jgi:GMP synthase (glutamine-hydrolysing)
VRSSVVDFGAQYAQLIARRVREHRVYSEIVPHRITAAEVAAKEPTAIILSGGPKSVHVEGAPSLDPAIYDLGVPILGICYGAQLIAQQLGGHGRSRHARRVRPGPDVPDRRGRTSELLHDGIPAEQDVWMSHFDAVTEVPDGFVATASTPDAPVAAFESPERKIYGVQYHPEVVHSPWGMHVLERFLHRLAGCAVVDDELDHRRPGRCRSGPRSVRTGDLRAVSGGVDSRSRRRSCTGRSAPSSPASTSTPA